MEHLTNGNGHPANRRPAGGETAGGNGPVGLGASAARAPVAEGGGRPRPGPVGEVIDTSVAEFSAQACAFGVAPPFGAFVKVTVPERVVYGVVYAIHSGSLEPGGRPVLRGREEIRDQAIYDANPDLEQLLRTELSALIVGFAEPPGRPIRLYLPPAPPPLHWSVVECDASETARLAERLDYFRTILAAPNVPADALLAANIRIARDARPGDPGFLVRAGREIATLLKHDYPRLTAILRALAD